MNKTSFNVAAAGILAACAGAGRLGAPAGHMYAALMGNGYSLQDFEQIMGALVQSGHVVKHGECYTLTAKGAALNASIDAAIAEHQQRAAA